MRILKEADTKDIKVTHPGVLDVPEGKSFSSLPLSHFIDIAKSKGKGEVMKALLNLERWNKEKDPSVSKAARGIIDKLESSNEWKNIAAKSEAVMKLHPQMPSYEQFRRFFH